jgi:predicted permease
MLRDHFSFSLSLSPSSSSVYWVLYVGSALCILCTIAWIILAILLKHSRAFWLSLLFGPIGTFIRFTLSKYNNLFPKFPLFTFLVNIIGTGLYAAMFLVFHHKTGSLSFQYFDNPNTAPVDYLIPAITLGFCGKSEPLEISKSNLICSSRKSNDSIDAGE